MQNINLYDASLRTQRDWLGAGALAAVLAATLVGATAIALHAGWQAERLQAPARAGGAALEAQQAALQQLAAQLATQRPDARLAGEAASAQSALEQRQAALQMLRGGALGDTRGHAGSLQAFARQAIDGLWITGLVLDRGDMALRGRALAPELIPAYVGRLNQEPALQGRAFRALDIERPNEDAAPEARLQPRLASYVEFALTGSAGASVTKERP